MAARKQRLTERNSQVRKLFYDLLAKNPKWRIDAVIEEVAKKVFLSNRTVEAIINYEGIYNDQATPQKSNQLSIFNGI
ncbi:hypothetical protein JJC03_15570 [Flavobacterium oreochromis]|uniref:hypothetical protein n=1 Tax=Flavobacterium oreochromis TaxID=2906078 RepID=UPI001CE58A3F|nr:hypothetical protein [Flavobacterium oreochromis]QYS86318.1 hypothetical protein JJC03_15570 [Flavobacterium oreochromis]